MSNRLSKGFKSFGQRTLFSFEQFTRNEMANHASAGAYAFLLSAMPALLVVAYISSILYRSLNLDSMALTGFLAPYLGSFGAENVVKTFLSKPIAGFAGFLGVINLIWAARLFVVSIQRGIRVVYADVVKTNPLRENILTFAMELILLFAGIVLIAAVQILRTMVDLMNWQAARVFFGGIALLGLKFLPFAMLWIFIFLTYRTIPAHKPQKKNAGIAALLCVVAYWFFGFILGLFLNTGRYGVLYGIFGNLIGGLIKVYGFFWLYYFFAELTYTTEFFDSLLFTRFRSVNSGTAKTNAVERSLFSEPASLFTKYAHEYEAGSILFEKGELNRDAFYLYIGSVGIFLGSPPNPETHEIKEKPVSVIKTGEFFGEMASLLAEPRSGWAVAMQRSTIIRLPPAMFERYLASAPLESRRMIELLASRLKANNAKMHRPPAAPSGTSATGMDRP